VRFADLPVERERIFLLHIQNIMTKKGQKAF